MEGEIGNEKKRNPLTAKQQESYRLYSDRVEFIKLGLQNSNEAWEQAYSISKFMEDFDNDEENKEINLKLKDYILGGVLLSTDQTKSYLAYDTKDEKIAKYISKLYHEYLERNPERK